MTPHYKINNRNTKLRLPAGLKGPKQKVKPNVRNPTPLRQAQEQFDFSRAVNWSKAHTARGRVRSLVQYSFCPLEEQTEHLAQRGSFGVTDWFLEKVRLRPFSSPSSSVQQQIVTLRSSLKGAPSCSSGSSNSRFSAFAGNCKQSQQPPPTHAANSCQEVLLHGHQWMQTKVNRDFGSSNTPGQHHFEDRWSLKTNKIPSTHSCSPISGLWPRKDSSCNIFSWTRAVFISWRQEISSRLWQWTHVTRHLTLSH